MQYKDFASKDNFFYWCITRLLKKKNTKEGTKHKTHVLFMCVSKVKE